MTVMASVSAVPEALRQWAAAAQFADNRLIMPPIVVGGAMYGLLARSSEFVPAVDEGLPDRLRAHAEHNGSLAAFVVAVADAFEDLDAAGADGISTVDEGALNPVIDSWRRAHSEAFRDAEAIRAALDRGDEDALAEALRVAEARSDGGLDESYSAMVIMHLGRNGIERVLDEVDRQRHSTLPERGQQAALIDPLAVLFGAATRSQNIGVMNIAYELLWAAQSNNQERRDMDGQRWADEVGRSQLADLLSAGTAEPVFTAEAADTLLDLTGPPLDDDDERHLVIALDALGRNPEAAHHYTTADQTQMRPLTDRLEQLLQPVHQTLMSRPGGIARDTEELWAASEAMAARSATVLQAGLADWPARGGDPALTPSVVNPAADRAASATAEIARLLPETRSPNGITGESTVLTDRLASITSNTWMQDRLVRGATLGTGGDIDGPPGAPITMEELVNLNKELVDYGGAAPRTLQDGVVAYTDYQVAGLLADGIDNVDELASNDTSTPDIDGNHLPDLNAAGGSVAALAEAHQRLAEDDVAREERANSWFDAASGSTFRGLGTAIPGPIGIGFSVGAPLLSQTLGEIVHGTPTLDGSIDSQQVRLSTGSLLGDVDAMLTEDPRFAALGDSDRRAVAQQVTDTVFDAITDSRVDADK